MTRQGNSSISADLPNLRLAIVLLAAGEGSRMGSFPKALLKKDGKTLLAHFCHAINDIHPIEIVVLTGFHAQSIENEISLQEKLLDLRMTVIRHHDPQQGQPSSVRLALESLKSDFEVLAVCLSDQPDIGTHELTELLQQFAKRRAHIEMILPMVQGQRGNPVLFSKKAVAEILSVPGMVCRSYMDQHPELVSIYETINTAFVLDVDTEEDIQKLGITRV